MKFISLRLIFLQFASFGTDLLIFSSSLGRAAVLVNLNEEVRGEDQEKKGRIKKEDVRDRGEEKKGRKSKIKKPKK